MTACLFHSELPQMQGHVKFKTFFQLEWVVLNLRVFCACTCIFVLGVRNPERASTLYRKEENNCMQ